MNQYRSIPVQRRANGVLIEATPQGCWITWPSGALLFLSRTEIENYRDSPARAWIGGTISSSRSGLFISLRNNPPVYFTDGELKQIAAAIRHIKETQINVG